MEFWRESTHSPQSFSPVPWTPEGILCWASLRTECFIFACPLMSELLIACGFLPGNSSQICSPRLGGAGPLFHRLLISFHFCEFFCPLSVWLAHDCLPTDFLVMFKVLRKGQSNEFGVQQVRETRELLFSLQRILFFFFENISLEDKWDYLPFLSDKGLG